MTITKQQAKAELARRVHNRKSGTVRREPKSVEAQRLSKKELQAIAGTTPEVNTSKPKSTGRGSRGGNPVKAALWAEAEAIAKENDIPIRSKEFWPIYKSLTAAAREAGAL